MNKYKISFDTSPVINPDIYESPSLQDSIDYLSDSKNEVNIDVIINMVAKYFLAFCIGPSTSNTDYDQHYVSGIINLAHEWFGIVDLVEKEASIAHLFDYSEVEEFFDFFKKNAYALGMLGDVGATSKIVQNIISVILQDEDERYLGLDLGTGSGILLLAQYIQAKRNNKTDIVNIGIDRKNIDTVQGLTKHLGIGEVVKGDTTNFKTYNKIFSQLDDRNVSYISSENITTTGIAMGVGPDPFHQNNRALFRSQIADKIHTETQMFPDKINMLLDLEDMGLDKQEIEGNIGNKFHLNALLEIEKQYRDIERNPREYGANQVYLPQNWNIFHQIYPLGVDIGNGYEPMHTIGKDLYTQKKLVRLEQWRNRWSKRQHTKNQQKGFPINKGK